jgi:hypothetical protein
MDAHGPIAECSDKRNVVHEKRWLCQPPNRCAQKTQGSLDFRWVVLVVSTTQLTKHAIGAESRKPAGENFQLFAVFAISPSPLL